MNDQSPSPAQRLPRRAQSPKEPQFVQDPYPFYAALRAAGRVVYWDELSLPVIAGFSGVNMALRDNRFGRQAPDGFALDIPAHLRPFYDIDDHSMLELEGARHRRLRSLVLRAFTTRRIATLVPDIEEICATLLEDLAQLPPDEPVDLLTQYCQAVPIRVICRLLGMPEDKAGDMLRWSHDMVALYTPNPDRKIENAAAAAAREFADFLRHYVAQRRDQPGDDLITELIAAEDAGDKLSTDELIATCVLLMNAGHEATVHALGNAVKTLLEQGTPQTALGPDTIDGTVEELLRFDPPLHLFKRWVYEDTRFLGHDFKRGDQIGLLLGAAGRDPDIWDGPDRFDPTRKTKQNMAFGAGVHFCVGAPLARLEMRCALPMLFARFPDLALAAPPRYADSWHFHGLACLDVRLGAPCPAPAPQID